MKSQEFITQLQQPSISPKAIFMAGVPGAGKSTVSTALLGAQGFQRIDIDQVWQLYKKKHGKHVNYDSEYHLLDNPTQRRLAFLSQRGQNLVIDGTGKTTESIVRSRDTLKKLGYVTGMIYVKIDPDQAVQNTISRVARIGRQIPPGVVQQVADQLNKNIPVFQQIFGYTNFFTVTTDNMDFAQAIHPQIAPSVIKRMNIFLKAK